MRDLVVLFLHLLTRLQPAPRTGGARSSGYRPYVPIGEPIALLVGTPERRTGAVQ